MDALGIPVVEAPGYEADDVLATLATEARDRQCDVVVVTGDRDSFQLIEDPHVRVLYNRRGVSDYSLYDEAGIVERTGVPPSKYVLLAALRGDPSDNLPGVPGVGEKTAAKLLLKYGDLDGIFAHLDEQSPKLAGEPGGPRGPRPFQRRRHPTGARRAAGRQRQRAPARRVGPRGRGSRVRPLRTEDPMGPHRRPAAVGRAGRTGRWAGSGAPRTEDALAQDARAVDDDTVDDQPVAAPESEVRVPTTADQAMTDLGALGDGEVSVAARWLGVPGRSDLVGLVLAAGNGEAVMVPAALLTSATVSKKLNAVLGRSGGHVVGHHVKEVMRSLLPLGIDITGLSMDVAVAAYLLDASTGEYELDTLREGGGQLRIAEHRGTRPRSGRRRHSKWPGPPPPMPGARPGWPRRTANGWWPRRWSRCTTTSRTRWSGSWPKWRWPGSASTARSSRASRTASRSRRRHSK